MRGKCIIPRKKLFHNTVKISLNKFDTVRLNEYYSYITNTQPKGLAMETIETQADNWTGEKVKVGLRKDRSFNMYGYEFKMGKPQYEEQVSECKKYDWSYWTVECFNEQGKVVYKASKDVCDKAWRAFSTGSDYTRTADTALKAILKVIAGTL